MLGQRWAAALKRRYPGQRRGSLDVKACAAAMGVSPKTAEHWGGAAAPTRRHLLRAFRQHGWAFLAEVFGDPLPTEADVRDEVAEARAQLRRLDHRFARLGGGGHE